MAYSIPLATRLRSILFVPPTRHACPHESRAMVCMCPILILHHSVAPSDRCSSPGQTRHDTRGGPAGSTRAARWEYYLMVNRNLYRSLSCHRILDPGLGYPPPKAAQQWGSGLIWHRKAREEAAAQRSEGEKRCAWVFFSRGLCADQRL
jgi:hypothetical protein